MSQDITRLPPTIASGNTFPVATKLLAVDGWLLAVDGLIKRRGLEVCPQSVACFLQKLPDIFLLKSSCCSVFFSVYGMRRLLLYIETDWSVVGGTYKSFASIHC